MVGSDALSGFSPYSASTTSGLRFAGDGCVEQVLLRCVCLSITQMQSPIIMPLRL